MSPPFAKPFKSPLNSGRGGGGYQYFKSKPEENNLLLLDNSNNLNYESLKNSYPLRENGGVAIPTRSQNDPH